MIKISLGGVDVGETEGAGPLRAVGSLPVAATGAHIERAAGTVSTASVGALRRDGGRHRGKEGNGKLHFTIPR